MPIYVAELVYFDTVKELAIIEAENRKNASEVINAWVENHQDFDDMRNLKLYEFRDIKAIWVQANGLELVIS